VRIFGEEYDVRAKIEKLEGYSAHADRDELLTWVKHFDSTRLKQVFLVHAEEEPALMFMGVLQRAGLALVEFPERGQTFTL